MSERLIGYSLSEHPAPHRERVSLWALFYGMFAAPIVWSGQLMVTYAFVAHGCYPGDVPHAQSQPPLTWAWTGVLVVDLAALCLIASGLWAAYRCWSLTDAPRAHGHHLMDVGQGRIHYFAVVGMGFSLMFLLIVATEIISLAFVPLCQY